MSFDFRFVMMTSASIPESSKQDGIPSIEWLSEMPEPAKDNPLTSREVDVLRLIAAGKSNTRIADPSTTEVPPWRNGT